MARNQLSIAIQLGCLLKQINSMPILPAKDLVLLKYHSEIFPEYIHTQVRFAKSELIRWKFPNSWGASLVTTDYKHKQDEEYERWDEWWTRHDIYDDYHKETDKSWRDKFRNYSAPSHTELVSLSFHTKKEGSVYYNYVLPEPLSDVRVADLVIVLSRIIGIKMDIYCPEH